MGKVLFCCDVTKELLFVITNSMFQTVLETEIDNLSALGRGSLPKLPDKSIILSV